MAIRKKLVIRKNQPSDVLVRTRLLRDLIDFYVFDQQRTVILRLPTKFKPPSMEHALSLAKFLHPKMFQVLVVVGDLVQDIYKWDGREWEESEPDGEPWYLSDISIYKDGQIGWRQEVALTRKISALTGD